jgi:hypothetical protein
MSAQKIYYYRIFDDKEETNYIRTSIENNRIRELLKEFEKTHSEYYNKDFFEFLKTFDPSMEVIEITNIYY